MKLVDKFNRVCNGKLKYDSMEQAIRKRKEIQKKYNRNVIAYYCHFCTKFHIGKVRRK